MTLIAEAGGKKKWEQSLEVYRMSLVSADNWQFLSLAQYQLFQAHTKRDESTRKYRKYEPGPQSTKAPKKEAGKPVPGRADKDRGGPTEVS